MAVTMSFIMGLTSIPLPFLCRTSGKRYPCTADQRRAAFLNPHFGQTQLPPGPEPGLFRPRARLRPGHRQHYGRGRHETID